MCKSSNIFLGFVDSLVKKQFDVTEYWQTKYEWKLYEAMQLRLQLDKLSSYIKNNEPLIQNSSIISKKGDHIVKRKKLSSSSNSNSKEESIINQNFENLLKKTNSYTYDYNDLSEVIKLKPYKQKSSLEGIFFYGFNN